MGILQETKTTANINIVPLSVYCGETELETENCNLSKL